MCDSFPKIMSWEYEKITDEGFTRRLRCVCLDGMGKVQCFVSDSYNFSPNFSEEYFEVEIYHANMDISDCVQYALSRSDMSDADLVSYDEFD